MRAFTLKVEKYPFSKAPPKGGPDDMNKRVSELGDNHCHDEE